MEEFELSPQEEKALDEAWEEIDDSHMTDATPEETKKAEDRFADLKDEEKRLESPPPASEADKIAFTLAVLDRLSSIKNPDAQDRYQRLLATALDDCQGDLFLAMTRADMEYALRPLPAVQLPEEDEEDTEATQKSAKS
jgi:hypothetical protein